MIHVRQRFQAVGHGTFFTGLLLPDDLSIPSFTWVYDCGSKRTTRIAAEIDDIALWKFWPQKIDLLVLSHFDDDHVNGVERLLRSRSVDKLMLPYMDTAQRLAQAAAIGCDPCSSSTALFQLDPMRWLSVRGLAERVDSVMFVRGGQDDDGNGEAVVEPRPFPNPYLFKGNRDRGRDTEIDGLFRQDYAFEDGVAGSGGPEVMLWHHTWSAAHGNMPVEFRFFNTVQHKLFVQAPSGERVAKRSGVKLARVQAEIQSMIDRYGLTHVTTGPKRQWREKLRKLYDSHFGHSGQARNNISLCLLVRPLSAWAGYCSCFHQCGVVGTSPTSRWGVLCLGDLRIDSSTVDAMKKHYGMTRWDSLALVQVPHHGSEHSWEPGNAKLFDPDLFVHCVPDSSGHYPHHDVVKDLSGHPVVHADYRTGVAFDYYVP